MTESELIDYNETIVDFAALINQYGMRRILMDFQSYYPDFFEEMKVQINRFPDKPVAALLRK